MRSVAAAAAGRCLLVEAWAAAYYRDESCGPARRPPSLVAAVCAVDEAALCGAAPSFTAADFRRNRRRCRGPSHDGSAWTCRRAKSPFPGAGKLSGATQLGWGRRLFPSSLRGSSRPGGIGWYWRTPAGRQRRPPRRATKTRFALRQPRRRGAQSARSSFVPDTAVGLFYTTSLLRERVEDR